MLKIIIGFNKGLMGMPFPWPVWLMVLVGGNMIAPLFLLDHMEAQVTFGVFLAGAVLMTAIYAVTGFTRLLGAGHVLWLGLVPWLWFRLDLAWSPEQPLNWFSYWIIAVMVSNSLSLVIDIADVIRYVRGEREATVVPK
ncbi:MAG: hypothetical protein HOK21_24805 [Rhodospirillaceae bacterium]|jgi:hypothetical protein|nr:hypothetical protein [Rhodospirillaceae bacterium]MBT4691587.1 hypothetical protein [Rhodospirillaceae bacterium]MBT5079529.1 hypothetical protein [Rhodospirillaceae bacterium]MBT5527321.1 hypothetical protein [Rhodospirillaceae bacterium]MBT5879396.1 hypothetical protein [Rhodospirillaceae bacterium]